ncbi:gluconate 2-dehydrogenase subunit 3 family protein [Leifsonia shinshuensis]
MDIALNRRLPRSARTEGSDLRDGTRPPMGGWLPGIAFDPLEVAVLDAFVDQLIPPGDGFPAPSEVDVAAFFARYIVPSGVEPKWYPFIGEERFRDWLGELGEGFVAAGADEQVKIISDLERTQPEFFGTLRDLTYYAYYSRPAITGAINARLEAGKDLRNSPQPYGYADSTEEWDEQLFPNISGTYTRTEDVRRVAVPAPSAAPTHEEVER